VLDPRDAAIDGARFAAPAVILITVALLLVACGSPEASPTPTATPTPTTATPTPTAGGPSLTAPGEVEAGAEFEVAWTGPDGEGDFVSLVAPGVDTWTNERYFYTSSGPSGTLVAPVADGPYELVYFTGSDREALVRVPITVTPFVGSVSAPETVAGGTEFEVSWTGPDGPGDYISILPAGATAWTNETYFYTRTGSTGTLLAPVEKGDYEIWYITGTERALMVSKPIAVESAKASVQAPPEVAAGSSFEASWTGPDGPGDYISIVPADATVWTNESYFYTGTGPSGTLIAPVTDGDYQVVYITGADRAFLAGVPITVTPLEISLTAPATVQRGSEFEVSWTGPDAPGDYITILPAGAAAWTNEGYFYTSAGSSGTLTAPDTPGAYEIWYIFGGSRELLESIAITVD
jgi:Ca-activated chloride channel homolog